MRPPLVEGRPGALSSATKEEAPLDLDLTRKREVGTYVAGKESDPNGKPLGGD